MEEAKFLSGDEGGRAWRYTMISMCSDNVGASLKIASAAVCLESCLVTQQSSGSAIPAREGDIPQRWVDPWIVCVTAI